MGFLKDLELSLEGLYQSLSSPQIDKKLKVPHIGWSELVPTLENNFGQTGYLKDFKKSTHVYFVHSYMASPGSPQDILSETIYGGHRIPAIIGKGNVIGCQFHPEKAGKAGIDLIQRFINWKQKVKNLSCECKIQ